MDTDNNKWFYLSVIMIALFVYIQFSQFRSNQIQMKKKQKKLEKKMKDEETLQKNKPEDKKKAPPSPLQNKMNQEIERVERVM